MTHTVVFATFAGFDQDLGVVGGKDVVGQGDELEIPGVGQQGLEAAHVELVEEPDFVVGPCLHHVEVFRRGRVICVFLVDSDESRVGQLGVEADIRAQSSSGVLVVTAPSARSILSQQRIAVKVIQRRIVRCLAEEIGEDTGPEVGFGFGRLPL